MHEFFKCARKFEIAQQCATGQQDSPTEKKGSEFSEKHIFSQRASGKDRKSTRDLDDPETRWGPSRRGKENYIVRKTDAASAERPMELYMQNPSLP